MSAVAAIRERVSSIADEISDDMPPKEMHRVAFRMMTEAKRMEEQAESKERGLME